MDGWQDHLHFDLLGEHVLFPALHLDSAWHFIEAGVLTIVVCVLERLLTYAISKNWSPLAWTQRSRLRKALWKSALYWLVTFLRLMYMLIAMTFSLWLIIITVTTLSFGQFIIEYMETPNYDSNRDLERIKEPLLSSSNAYESAFPLHPYGAHEHANDTYPYDLSPSSVSSSSLPRAHSSSSVNVVEQSTSGRPRSKSKPDHIWIHPAESNLARADAAALELGIGEDTDMVQGNQLPPDSEPAWEIGRGKDLAREIMKQGQT